MRGTFGLIYFTLFGLASAAGTCQSSQLLQSTVHREKIDSNQLEEFDSQKQGLAVTPAAPELVEAAVLETMSEHRVKEVLDEIQDEARASLTKCSSSFSTDSPVLATVFDSTYTPLMSSWVQRGLGFGFKAMVIACLDDRSCAEAHLLSAVDPEICVVPFVAQYDHSSRLPTLVGLAKFNIMATLADLGLESLTSEGDVYWFHNPLPLLIGALEMSGRPFAGAPGAKDEEVLNIGFVYSRPTATATGFLKKVVSEWSSILASDAHAGETLMEDQALFNAELALSPTPLVTNLDSTQFAKHMGGPDGDNIDGFRDINCSKTVLVHLTAFPSTASKVALLQGLSNNSITCLDLEKRGQLSSDGRRCEASLVFDVGLPRTGTTSMASFLSLLGFTSYHNTEMNVSFEEFKDCFDGGSCNFYKKRIEIGLGDPSLPVGFEDVPTPFLACSLAKQIPESKLILLTRDAESYVNAAQYMMCHFVLPTCLPVPAGMPEDTEATRFMMKHHVAIQNMVYGQAFSTFCSRVQRHPNLCQEEGKSDLARALWKEAGLTEQWANIQERHDSLVASCVPQGQLLQRTLGEEDLAGAIHSFLGCSGEVPAWPHLNSQA